MSNETNETATIENQEVAKIEPKEVVISADKVPDSLTDQLLLAEQLVKSGLTPHKRKEDALVAILMGQELGFKPLIALNGIHSINGKAGIGIHLVLAILQRNGVRYQVVKDFENVETPNPISTDGKPRPIDKETVVKFTRWYKNPDGTNERVDTTVSYKLSDAYAAGLMVKDNWIKMTKIMLRTRCLMIGARLVAPDFIQGMYETNELYEISNVEKKADDGGNNVIQTAEVVDK